MIGSLLRYIIITGNLSFAILSWLRIVLKTFDSSIPLIFNIKSAIRSYQILQLNRTAHSNARRTKALHQSDLTSVHSGNTTKPNRLDTQKKASLIFCYCYTRAKSVRCFLHCFSLYKIPILALLCAIVCALSVRFASCLPCLSFSHVRFDLT